MKKQLFQVVLLSAVTVLASLEIHAQIRNDRGTFEMPGKGDILVETQANLDLNGGRLFSLTDGFLSTLNTGLGADTLHGNSFPTIKLRKFLSNGMATRMMIHISYDRAKTTIDTMANAASSFGVALTYGFEKIFTPAERLNTYIGADLSFGFSRVANRTEVGNNEVKSSQNAWGLGLKGFTGMDYYVLPKVYLGLELGYGVAFSHYSPWKTETSTGTVDNKTKSEGITLTPYVTPIFRLGYVLGCGRKAHTNSEPDYRSRSNDSDDE
jgi:hypothetical protein